MPQSTVDWVSAIGSFGTAVAAVIALIALYVTITANRNLQIRTEATQIRNNLALIAQESDLIADVMREGSPLVLGGTAIAQEVRSRLGSEPTAENFWAILHGENSTKLSIAITGWKHAGSSSEIDDRVNRLRKLRVLLSGELTLLQYPVELFDGIVSDAYSAMIFFNILSLPEGNLLKEYREEESVARLTEHLAAELYGNASLYFRARYEQAISTIDSFVQEAVRAFAGLDDSELVMSAHSSVADAVSQQTRTASMRILLNQLKNKISKDQFEKISSQIDSIEGTISKEVAHETLGKLK